jgi:Tfp pilus assembly protein FimV
MASLALLLAGLGSASAAQAGLGPIHVLSADGEAFSAEIPVVNEDIQDFAQVNLADRNNYPLLSAYSGSAPTLQFSLVRGSDGHLQKVLVKGPSSFGEPLLRFAVEVGWPDGRLVREFEVDYKRDGPRRKAPVPAGDDGKRHAATPDQGSRLDGAGLGDIRVNSRLGEPLMAELPLLGGVFDKAEQLQVAIYADTSQSGQVKELLRQVSSISYQHERSADGRRMLTLASSVPITLPQLAFRVEVAAGSVKAQKSYVLALEGAGAAGAQAKAADHAPQVAESAKSYKVLKGDTLSAIASRMHGHAKGEDVAARLLKDNPDAFIRGDANRLLAGADLRYPAEWKMRDLARKDASEKAQPPASPGAMAKLLEQGRQADQAGKGVSTEAKSMAKPEASAAKPAAIARPASSPAVLAAEQKMRDRLHFQEQALKETEERTRALEEKIRALQQGKAKAAASMPMAAQAAKPEASAKPAMPSAQHKSAAAKPQPVVKAVASLPKAAEAATQPMPHPAPAPTPAPVNAPAPTAPSHPLTPKPATESVLDDALAVLSDRDVQIKLGGAAAALGLVALLLIRRKRQGKQEEAAGEASAGGSSRLALGPLAGLMSSLKNDDGADLSAVDVMAEAEVYLAYGRSDQAAAVLRAGLDKEPMRQDLRFKLLEVLASKPDKDAFLQEAMSAKSMFNPDSTMWQRICELGRNTVPGHVLFGVAAEPAAAAKPEPEMAPAPAPRAPAAAPEPAAPPPQPAAPAPAAKPAATAAKPTSPIAAPDVDMEKMELAKLYMEMGDKETAETLMREAQHGR